MFMLNLHMHFTDVSFCWIQCVRHVKGASFFRCTQRDFLHIHFTRLLS